MNETALVKQEQALQAPDAKEKFTAMLGSRAEHFVVAISTMLSENAKLAECQPLSIVQCAMKGAALDLSFDPSLGEAYMLPFKGKAVFVPGYKGLIQLALRTGEYEVIGGQPVTNRQWQALQEQIKKSSDITETVIQFFEALPFFEELQGGSIVGYIGYFRLQNGFKKYCYRTIADAVKHAEQYSPSSNGEGKGFKAWSAYVSHEDAMHLKGIYRKLLGTFGPKSKEMRTALESESQSMQYIEQEELRALSGIREGHEDEDLYGPELPQHTNGQKDWSDPQTWRDYIRALWKKYDIHLTAGQDSFKKYTRKRGEEMLLNACQDVDLLHAYADYKSVKCRENQQEAQQERAAMQEEGNNQEKTS